MQTSVKPTYQFAKPMCIAANQSQQLSMSNIATMRSLIQYYSCSQNSLLFSLRNARLSRLVVALLRLRALKSPHSENTRSTYACEAGHDTMSNAKGPIIE